MIDAHIHFWRYAAADYPWITADMPMLRRDFLPDDEALAATPAMVAVQARGCLAENDFLLALMRDYPQVAAAVGWLDFCAADIDARLDEYAPPLAAFRHIVQDEPDPSAFLARADFNRGIRALQQRSGVYEVLVRQRDLDAARAFCARHDRAPLILDHLGKPDFSWPFAAWRQGMRELAAMDHVAVKLSGLPLEAGREADFAEMRPYWAEALELFGAGRCLWGSDWPVSRLAHEDDAVRGLWQRFAASLSASERHAVTHATAARLYDLEDTP
ncbi:MAG: amidohydrolase family protein [Cardiobacteriaceae bacterium]|nr:amidohydrolase family protein [Cardiobacteriaceae bacterium]